MKLQYGIVAILLVLFVSACQQAPDTVQTRDQIGCTGCGSQDTSYIKVLKMVGATSFINIGDSLYQYEILNAQVEGKKEYEGGSTDHWLFHFKHNNTYHKVVLAKDGLREVVYTGTYAQLKGAGLSADSVLYSNGAGQLYIYIEKNPGDPWRALELANSIVGFKPIGSVRGLPGGPADFHVVRVGCRGYTVSQCARVGLYAAMGVCKSLGGGKISNPQPIQNNNSVTVTFGCDG